MPIGSAMFFVLSLAASAIIGLIVVTYAARTFMNVLNGTAAGNNDVPWPKDPYIDWLGDPLFLIYLVALPSVAAFGIVAIAVPDLLDRPGGAGLVLAGVVWLVFPIMLLSALSGTSRWCVLHWEFLRRMPRRPIALVLFYLSTGLVLCIAGGSAFLVLFHPSSWAVVVVVAVAACVMIQARLFGRFAWVVSQTPVGIGAKRRPRIRGVVASDPWQISEDIEHDVDVAPAAAEQQTAIKIPDSQPVPVVDASAADDAEEDEWTPNKKPYVFVSDAPAPVPERAPASKAHREAITASRRLVEDDEEDRAELNMQPPVDERARPTHTEIPQPDRIELRWMEGRKMPPMPRAPLVNGVWTFPFRSSALERLVTLSALLLLWGAIIRFMLMLAKGEIAGAL